MTDLRDDLKHGGLTDALTDLSAHMKTAGVSGKNTGASSPKRSARKPGRVSRS